LLGYDDIQTAISEGQLIIDPHRPRSHQSASVDLHLDRRYLISKDRKPVDRVYLNQPMPDDLWASFTASSGGTIPVMPGQLILASTEEWVILDETLAASVEGISSLGRSGLTVLQTAGHIDPGFRGHITLEIKNENLHRELYLAPGMRICQIRVFRLDTPTTRPYNGRYQDQAGASGAKGTV
jgi:dCTP deaminase